MALARYPACIFMIVSGVQENLDVAQIRWCTAF